MAEWWEGHVVQCLHGGREVEGLEWKRVKPAWSKQTVESEGGWVDMWVLQALQVEVEFMNMVWAMHNLVM